ncbi:hypothetical protein AN403_5615 [Pseudomonas fluorescens]|uniref:Uncharacterized protein n=1 Tax=Pseudomonas fluorescens TaxID=294 RepID=A0A0P8Z7W4_PSEFL|nr:hypothetical protein AN403_5615 [Pseudomonas fluorescens]
MVSSRQNPLCRALWKGSPEGVMLFSQGSCRSKLAPTVASGRQGATVAERMPGNP